MNEISIIKGIECYEQDGTAYLKLDTVAWGLGFTQVQKKGGKEYASVRWETVNRYLSEIGFPRKLGKDDFVPENVFYRLAMKAKNEKAEKFQAMVADEVLPSIRKHGAYLTPEKLEDVLLNPDTLIQLAQNLKEEQEKRRALEAKVEQDKPKVVFAEAVETSRTSILVGELAKLLKQNGVEMGQKRLFQWMRENGFLIARKETDYNMPTQKSMELGLFEIKERTISDPAGVTRITKTPKITGKGQTYFINRFLREAA